MVRLLLPLSLPAHTVRPPPLFCPPRSVSLHTCAPRKCDLVRNVFDVCVVRREREGRLLWGGPAACPSSMIDGPLVARGSQGPLPPVLGIPGSLHCPQCWEFLFPGSLHCPGPSVSVPCPLPAIQMTSFLLQFPRMSPRRQAIQFNARVTAAGVIRIPYIPLR